MNYRISFLLHWALKLTGQARLERIHPEANGWAGVIEDTKDEQKYNIYVIPIKKVPAYVDELLEHGGL